MTATIGTGLAWFLVWLFAQAAVYKLAAPHYYRKLMTRYLGGRGGGLALWLVVALEAGIALAVLLPPSRRVGLAAAAAVLLAYGALMAGQIVRGKTDMECGCAGPDSQLEICWTLVLRNGVCAALALLAMSTAGGTADGWAGIVLPGFVALFLILVYATSGQIISNTQWMEGEG